MNDHNNNNHGNGSQGVTEGLDELFGLFQSAHQDGTLSAASMQTLTIVDPGAQIQAGLGVRVEDVAASEVVLVAMMPDDSGSIRFAGNAEAVRRGHNAVLDALARSRQQADILVHTRYLNGHVLFPFCPIDQAVRMDKRNYNPSLGTPLYEQTVTLLATMVAKAQEFVEQGVPARTVTLLITDGADMHSSRARARDVANLVRDMQRAEQHVVAAMGISDGSTDFRAVFDEMGIDPRWVMTPGSSASEIRRAFQVFSQSAVRVSQAASFSGATLGGFAG